MVVHIGYRIPMMAKLKLRVGRNKIAGYSVNDDIYSSPKFDSAIR